MPGPESEAPACDFYAATFERLFRVLVHPAARVTETACEACGDDACQFEIEWRALRIEAIPLSFRRAARRGPRCE